MLFMIYILQPEQLKGLKYELQEPLQKFISIQLHLITQMRQPETYGDFELKLQEHLQTSGITLSILHNQLPVSNHV